MPYNYAFMQFYPNPSYHKGKELKHRCEHINPKGEDPCQNRVVD